MPIMAARHYNNGKLVRDLGPDEIIPEDCADDDFFWLGLYEPTPGELAGIAKRFGLHPLAVEDALKAKQLPKVEIYGDQLFVIAATAKLDGDAIQPGETAIFLGRHFVVTVRHGSGRGETEGGGGDTKRCPRSSRTGPIMSSMRSSISSSTAISR